MLKAILDSASIKPRVCAGLLGIDYRIFHEWLVGQRPVPDYILPELSSVLGVPPDLIIGAKSTFGPSVENAPAVWFKFREGERLIEADREIVVLIRRLGHFVDQLYQITGVRPISWRVLFDAIRGERNKQAPFKEQGRKSARLLSAERQFTYPREGVGGAIWGTGDIFRNNLRSLGILVIESPVPSSNLEGCSFYVGPPGAERPCIFANTYQQTWFRRNTVLMHELAHAIFDIENDAASLDFKEDEERSRQAEEQRAQAFAHEVFASKEILHHMAQTKGLRWDGLTVRALATLVAFTQVEQKSVIQAALEAGFINAHLAAEYARYEIHDELKELTDRALSTNEYFATKGIAPTVEWSAEKRTTSIPARALRLPVPYVGRVLELLKAGRITRRKAMQFLMIDEDVFRSRFGELVPEVAL